MRETRSSGSVEGVMSNRDPYSDYGSAITFPKNGCQVDVGRKIVNHEGHEVSRRENIGNQFDFPRLAGGTIPFIRRYTTICP